MTVIGNKDCPRCDMVIELLKKHNKKYEHKIFDNLEKDEQVKIGQIAKDNNIAMFPLILEDEKVIEFKDFIKDNQ